MTVALGHTLGGQDPAYRSSLAHFFRFAPLFRTVHVFAAGSQWLAAV